MGATGLQITRVIVTMKQKMIVISYMAESVRFLNSSRCAAALLRDSEEYMLFAILSYNIIA
jgi:hypothetical protein